jgi:hypothetical protein
MSNLHVGIKETDPGGWDSEGVRGCFNNIHIFELDNTLLGLVWQAQSITKKL